MQRVAKHAPEMLPRFRQTGWGLPNPGCACVTKGGNVRMLDRSSPLTVAASCSDANQRYLLAARGGRASDARRSIIVEIRRPSEALPANLIPPIGGPDRGRFVEPKCQSDLTFQRS
jgi:hypothetical protein